MSSPLDGYVPVAVDPKAPNCFDLFVCKILFGEPLGAVHGDVSNVRSPLTDGTFLQGNNNFNFYEECYFEFTANTPDGLYL
jgi:hypothetical protein